LLGRASVDERPQIRQPDANTPRAELYYLELLPFMASPERVWAHACKVRGLWKANDLVDVGRIGR
jgi:hypothetical protein